MMQPRRTVKRLALPRLHRLSAAGTAGGAVSPAPPARARVPRPLAARAQLLHARDLLWALVLRDMKIRYEGTLLGFAWMLAKPLLFVGVFVFVFQVVLTLDLPRFTSFAFIGILVYGWFQSALVEGAFVALGNRELVRRPQFPVAVLPLVPVAVHLVHLLLSLPILAAALVLGGSRPSAALLAIPLVIAVQLVLTAGLAYFAAALSVLFRDTGHLLGVVLTAFFFVSPVFYDAALVPTALQPLYRLNPLVGLLESYRNPLLHGLPPDWGSLATVAACALPLAAAGYHVFQRVSHRFAEEL